MARKPTTPKYLFSFVMPVYNVEAYLAETVESILAQSLDFEQNCEIIFVNDGSPDNSEEICLRYKEQFPGNVTYIKQTNQGVSAARNRGIKEVQGKYISFLDGDDKLSENTLEEVYGFFEKHYEEIDFTSIKLEFFGALEGDHPLNYKYNRTRVVDITKEYDCVQLSGGSVFVKSEAFDQGYRFDTHVQVSEDSKLLTEMILSKMAYGVVAEPTYYYRKRERNTSAVGGSTLNKSWYFNTPSLVYEYLFHYSKDKLGYVPKYVQYLVMYDLQWRIKQTKQMALTETEVARYKKLIYGLLAYIDDDVIMAQRVIQNEYKYFVLNKKHNGSLTEAVIRNGSKYYYEGTLIYNYEETKPFVHVELINTREDSIVIEGFFNGFLFKGSKLQFKVGTSWYDTTPVNRPLIQAESLGEVVFSRNPFTVEIPISYGSAIIPFVVNGETEERVQLYAHNLSRLNRLSRNSYRICKKFILVLDGKAAIFVQKNTPYRRFIREAKRFRELVGGGRWKSACMRLAVLMYECLIKHKEVWIVSDRVNAAGDNGEALFRYAMHRRPKGVKLYFAIARDSDDHQRMKRYGAVVDRNGLRYKLLFLISDKIISSHADGFVTNAFEKMEPDFVDLYNFDFVFLQHGIIHNDLSAWLNRYNKNIALFVSSAIPEYKSLLARDYAYDKRYIKLTGLARYDFLENKPKNKLIIAPTWRRNILEGADQKTGKRPYSESFKQTDYHRFYQGLINDDRIIKLLRHKNMTAELYAHPSLETQARDFQGNDTFTVKSIPYDYRTAFSEGNLLVTDYSSVAFDFAYLKKPVIYAQFDRQTFYDGQFYDPGYFSYEGDGFGPVVYDYEATVQMIMKIIESGCKVESKYQKRADKFFAYDDKDNSKRIYESIIAMNKGKSR